MSNVPKLRFKEFSGEWEEKILDKIAVFSKGKGISKIDIDENGQTECIRYGELYTEYRELIQNVLSKTNIDIKDLVLSEYGDIIIPASGETQIDIATASCVLKDNVALGGDLNIIKTKEDGVFLSYYLNNAKRFDIARLSQGISVVHLYSSQLKTLKLNLPSKPEQEKIALFLTSVDTKIELLVRKEELLQQYKKGVMQKIFSQEIRFKADDGSEYPEWENKKLHDIFEEITKNVGKSNIKTFSITAGKGFVSQSEKFGKDISGKQNEKYIVVHPNEFSFNKGNSKIYKYGCIYVNNVGEPIAVPNVFISFKLRDEKMSVTFFAKMFENHYLDKGLRKIISSSARMDGLLNINKNNFFKLKLPLPSKSEQTKIANFLSSIDSKIERIQKQLNSTKAFKKALLQQMFV